MTNKTVFKISSKDFNSHVGRELEQSIRVSEKDYSMFEFVLNNKVKRVNSITPWSENDGFFYCGVEFESNFILDGIKALSGVGSILGNCRLDVMMESEIKHGYYQYFNGKLECGFSICKDNAFYLKLVEDFRAIQDFEDSFRVSLVQKLENPEYDFNKDRETNEMKVYSFFGDETSDRERLCEAIKALGEISYRHIGVSPDSVDPEPTTIDLNCDEFLKEKKFKTEVNIPEECREECEMTS